MEPLKSLRSEFTNEQQDVSSFSEWNRNSRFQGRSIGALPDTYPRIFVISVPADIIFVACVWEFEELFDRCVNADLRSLDVRNSLDMTALHITCQVGNLEAARTLLEKGVDIEAIVGRRTALGNAVFLPAHGHCAAPGRPWCRHSLCLEGRRTCELYNHGVHVA